MKFQYFTSISLGLSLLTGCGDDVAKSSRNPMNRITPRIEGESGVISGVHRKRSTSPITYVTEIGANGENANIRSVPDIRFDDEGGDGENVSTRTSKGRPKTICGTAENTLQDKIADCSSKNETRAIWDGTLEAGSSEGVWLLVTLAEKDSGDGNYEVWFDKRTNMVWSDIIVNEANWCGASGSQLGPSDNVGEDCLTNGNGKSFCTKLNLTELPKVSWRLPTRHDYLQADLDGIRFVLSPGSNNFWTATVSSDVTKRDKAWTFNMINGTLASELMNTKKHVRCIGTPNF